MMKKKGWMLLGLAVMLAFTGCGKDGTNAPKTTATPKPTMAADVTVTPEPTEVPVATEKPEPTVTLEPTEVPVATEEPEPTVTSEPTEVPEKEEVSREFGITIGDEFYAFDAESGITDFQKIDGRVNVCKSELEVLYYEEGSSEPKAFEPAEKPGFGVYESDLVTAFWVYRHRWNHNADKTIASSVFRINRDYRTGDGLHGESTYEDALKYGYRPYMQNEAVRIFDCNGEADWEEAERLAKQAIRENSFACLKHIEDPFGAGLGDVFKMQYLSDDVSAFLEQLDRSYNQPPEDTFIGMIAQAMEVQKMQNGEIDCFVMYAVSFYHEEKKGFLPLEIHVYTKAENIEHWDESWGVNIQ